MIEITTGIDSYMKSLIRSLEMLWCVTLNNGISIYSDYNRYEGSPWERMILFCRSTGTFPVQVKSIMFGAPETIMVEDKKGLNGLFIKRGCIKDIDIDNDGTGTSISYKKLITGLYDPLTNKINVKKFCWPENEIEPSTETRLMTLDNIESMYFIDEQEKDKHKTILLSDDRRAV